MNLGHDNDTPIQLLFPLRISQQVNEAEKRKILSAHIKLVDFRVKPKPKPIVFLKTENDLTTSNHADLQTEECQITVKNEIIEEPKLPWEPVNTEATSFLSDIPSCRSKCTSRITLDDIKRLSNSYWKIETRESRLRYLTDMIDIRRASAWKNNITKPRRISSYTSFKIKTNEGHHKICRICLHRILNESTKFISMAVEKKWRELKNLNEPQHKVVQEKENSHVYINNFTPMITNQENSMTKTLEQVDPASHFLKNEKLKKGPTRLTPCPAKCYFKITQNDQIQIFESYWQNPTLHSRLQYLNEMVIPVHYMHSKHDFLSRERFTDSYYLDTSRGRQRVCKVCFCVAIDEPIHFISAVLSEKLCKFKRNLINSLRDEKLRKGYTRLSPCPRNCYLRVTDGDQETIFESYWHNPTLYSRLRYLNEMVKSVTYHDLKENREKLCYIYYLDTDTGRHRVCQPCFSLALDEPLNFISELLPEKLLEFNEFKESMEESRSRNDQRVEELDDQLTSFSEFNSTYCIVKEEIDLGFDKVEEEKEHQHKIHGIVSSNLHFN